MPYNTFPTLSGMGWDIKKRIITSTDVETSSSGAEYRFARWPGLPHFEFDLPVNYLSQADQDAIEAFFIQQNGPATPFLLGCVNNDNGFSAISCGTGNGSNKTFQIPLPAQAQVVSTTSVTDNGVAAGANSISATGLITFTTAPAAGHVIRWTGSYAYLVRFLEDTLEFNQLANAMYEVENITFRTVR